MSKCFMPLAGGWRDLYLNNVCERVALYGDEKNNFGLVSMYCF